MPTISDSSFPFFVTRAGLIKSTEDLLHVRIIRRDIFEKQSNDGTGGRRFVVTWVQVRNSQIIPTVAHPDLLPLMEEVLDALEALDV